MAKIPDKFYCNECQAMMQMKPPYLVARPVPGKHHKVVEVGLQCKRCNHWHHSYFDGPVLASPRRTMHGALKRMIQTQKPKDAERYLNAKDKFERTYREFQARMKAALGVESTAVLGSLK